MSKFEQTYFCIGSIPNKFYGYTDGSDWNGFACPFFEYGEAETVLAESKLNGYEWGYDTETDAFIVRSTADPQDWEPEVFKATQIRLVDGTEIRAYGIGAYSWTWHVCTEIGLHYNF